MADLRDRLRDLDDWAVPDILSRAHDIGPRTPMEHPDPRWKRTATIAIALVVAVASLVFVRNALERVPMPVVVPMVPNAECRFVMTEISLPPKLSGHLIDVSGTSFSDLWVGGSVHSGQSDYLWHFDGSTW